MRLIGISFDFFDGETTIEFPRAKNIESGKPLPSLKSVIRYAAAVNSRIDLKLVQANKSQHLLLFQHYLLSHMGQT
jgi:hypothetical protein